MVDSYAGYDTAHTRAAVGQRGPRGWLRVSGRDAVSFLHGILTNDIAGLRAGQWCYAAYLTPQGRMVSDMRVLRREGELAIEMEPHVAEKLGDAIRRVHLYRAGPRSFLASLGRPAKACSLRSRSRS